MMLCEYVVETGGRDAEWLEHYEERWNWRQGAERTSLMGVACLEAEARVKSWPMMLRALSGSMAMGQCRSVSDPWLSLPPKAMQTSLVCAGCRLGPRWCLRAVQSWFSPCTEPGSPSSASPQGVRAGELALVVWGRASGQADHAGPDAGL